MKKWILRGLLAVVLLLVVGIVVFLLSLDSLVRSGVVHGGTYATGQKTSLDTATLSLTGGTLQLTGLEIANPQGYKSKDLLTLKDVKVKVQTGSLFGDTAVVDEILIDGLEVNIEQKGLTTNLAEVLDVIKKQTAAGGQGGSSGSPGGKQLKIGVIKLTGTRVHLGAFGASMPLDLGPIELREPTNPDGRPMKIADVVGKVIIHVAVQIAQNPQIPAALKDGLGSATRLLQDTTKILEGGKDVGKELEKGVKDLGDMFK